MRVILKSPAKYIQGPGVLGELDQHLRYLGDNLLILLSEGGMRRSRPALDACFAGGDMAGAYHVFHGECCWAEIEQTAEAAKAAGAKAIVGVGGGKILDTAKAAAFRAGLPVVIVPTVASTDSPCSALSIIYRENGEFEQYLYLDRCPDVVLVDTELIANAPAALLTAGMGDAMATWFEARACRASGRDNQVGGKPTHAATALAEQCWKLLRQYGPGALAAVREKTCTPELEAIVEVNTYLSGVGFESGGLAAAHAIQKGFTYIPELHQAYHGDKVAFCTLVQLVLEGAEEIGAVLAFCREVGLPTTFAALGCDRVEEDLLRLAAEKACAPGSTIHNLPFAVTPQMVFDALLAADALGAQK